MQFLLNYLVCASRPLVASSSSPVSSVHPFDLNMYLVGIYVHHGVTRVWWLQGSQGEFNWNLVLTRPITRDVLFNRMSSRGNKPIYLHIYPLLLLSHIDVTRSWFIVHIILCNQEADALRLSLICVPLFRTLMFESLENPLIGTDEDGFSSTIREWAKALKYYHKTHRQWVRQVEGMFS